MQKTESIEDFYRLKRNWMPPNLKKNMGHFNVFKQNELVCECSKPIPYSRKEYFKISLFIGRIRIHYADRTIESDKYALLFADPMTPYSWEPLEKDQTGYCCIFTEAFFDQFGVIKEYPVFQPGNDKVFILTVDNLKKVDTIFLKMLDEISSDYIYKYDILRNLVFELIHIALRLKTASRLSPSEPNAATRIAALFIEFLERQFPIEYPMQRIQIRTPSDFAAQLGVHVNHLNRSLKEVTGKTTSQLITERISQEARVLLKHTDWNISEIAYSLGYEELPHFINFFRRNFQQTPKMYRLNQNV